MCTSSSGVRPPRAMHKLAQLAERTPHAINICECILYLYIYISSSQHVETNATPQPLTTSQYRGMNVHARVRVQHIRYAQSPPLTASLPSPLRTSEPGQFVATFWRCRKMPRCQYQVGGDGDGGAGCDVAAAARVLLMLMVAIVRLSVCLYTQKTAFLIAFKECMCVCVCSDAAISDAMQQQQQKTFRHARQSNFYFNSPHTDIQHVYSIQEKKNNNIDTHIMRGLVYKTQSLARCACFVARLERFAARTRARASVLDERSNVCMK